MSDDWKGELDYILKSSASTNVFFDRDSMRDYPIMVEKLEKLIASKLAEAERLARRDELNKLSYHQGTTLNGTEDIAVTLMYVADRLRALETQADRKQDK